MSKLHKLASLGQAVWLDYIRRAFLTSGELQGLIELGVRGMTSNPTIFEKAIASSQKSGDDMPGEYDADLQRLANDGNSPAEIFEALAIKDIQLAADLLRPTYDATNWEDGYVSLEVNPNLARESQATLKEAQRLWSQVDRPNLMIKIPATKEGLPAITSVTASGINVNVTLIFSLMRYQEVMDAYLKGLEQRLAAGKPVDHLASVASFFVSRVDTKVDKHLEGILLEEGPRAELAVTLLGKAAVANAKLAYSLFREVFESKRFYALKSEGARPQRPLWASTSTKNSAYSDILYVQELIGLHTVNTMPQNTLEAFLDHGVVRLTLEEGLDQSRLVIEKLESLGISMDQVTQELEDEGVEAFSKSFTALIDSIERRQEQLKSKKHIPTFSLGPYQGSVDAALEEMAKKEIITRIWREDFTVWKPDPAEITNRMGWLHVHEDMQARIPQLESVAYAVQNAGYTHVLLLGMGGSSLAPDLFSRTFSKPGQNNYPFLKLDVLDSTDPGTVLTFSERLDPAKTLFIVSTKSGTTEETLSLFKFFYNWTVNALGEREAGDHFIAITDPGSKLVDLARSYHFRATFQNDPNIGGRYSALSYFGLVPAAFMGINLRLLLERASQIAFACNTDIEANNNPAARLGATLGELAKTGRDKVTLFLSPQIAGFGDWVEQLIAESTGKDQHGILPVVGETIGTPGSYGSDRVFVLIQLRGDSSFTEEVSALEKASHPVIHLDLGDLYDLGGQFFLWELAIAIAGQRLGIQPFDQPNVESAKALARQRVTAFKQSGQLPIPDPALEASGTKVFGQVIGHTPGEALSGFLMNAKPGDYIAIQAFLQPTPATDQALRRLRTHLGQYTRLATTLGYGPRFLHSTGQLHKGDAGHGLFIQFTADDPRDIPIPDQAGLPDSSISFGVLKLAQALGDYQALLDTGRRIIRFHFKGDSAQKIDQLADTIEAS